MSMLQNPFHALQPVEPGNDGHEHASVSDASGSKDHRDETADHERYRLVSIEAAHAPEGCTGRDWFSYRIVQGQNGITGYRSGTLERVSTDVRLLVTSLNGRREGTKPPAKGSHRTAPARREAAK